jgi:hypothetical protein
VPQWLRHKHHSLLRTSLHVGRLSPQARGGIPDSEYGIFPEREGYQHTPLHAGHFPGSRNFKRAALQDILAFVACNGTAQPNCDPFAGRSRSEVSYMLGEVGIPETALPPVVFLVTAEYASKVT